MANTRVLVVDDSVVVRRMVADVLSAEPDIEVVGTAANGRIALTKIELLRPDLVTLDVEMPVLDGLETLPLLRGSNPDLPVIMFSTLTERGATATLTALELGADDYVTKPAHLGSLEEARAAVREALVPKVLALAGRRRTRVDVGLAREADRHHRAARTPAPAPAGPVRVRRRMPSVPVGVLGIGSSTGGPEALTQVLSALPADLGVPVLVAQHMPPMFTARFAERLDAKTPFVVREAVAGDRLLPGHVYVAPGDWHLRVGGSVLDPRVALDQGPAENYCRPAVDPLFRSLAEVYGAATLAVVLTGMGHDGAAGCVEVARVGGQVLAQDEATSVVWGMPGSVVAAGVADEVLALDQVAPTVARRVLARPVRRTTVGVSATPATPATPAARTGSPA